MYLAKLRAHIFAKKSIAWYDNFPLNNLVIGMDLFYLYLIFLAKLVTTALIVVMAAAAVAAIITSSKKQQVANKFTVHKLNKVLNQDIALINQVVLDKKARKTMTKKSKADKKKSFDRNLFILSFIGDINASATEQLTRQINALLQVAKPLDEVILKIDSAGGTVNGYGLAAAQLERLRARQLKLTVAIDKVAASGGYLMAVVANEIIAAPFAIIGSIGVVAQLPNFHRFLQKHDIDFEEHTAGEYKRTLSYFGDINDAKRDKFKQSLAEIHTMFKQHVTQYREVDIAKVATGEYWLGKKALELGLVDKIMTSDEFIMDHLSSMNIYSLVSPSKKKFHDRLLSSIYKLLNSKLLMAQQ